MATVLIRFIHPDEKFQTLRHIGKTFTREWQEYELGAHQIAMFKASAHLLEVRE